jgi:arsenate reductase-like glutaredoxin family protein
MKAREFLAQKKLPFEEQDVMKVPPTEQELAALAKKMGGVRQLIAPKRVAELASLPDAKVIPHLAKNPGHLRRPLFDLGDTALGGFTEDTRTRLLALTR